MKKPYRSYTESTRLLLTLLVSAIVIAEVLIMMVLQLLPPLPVWGEQLLDAGLLLTLVFPLLYFVLFRPLKTEIAARRSAESALRESEDKYSKVFHDAPVWIAITDLTDATYVEMNEQGLRDSGFTREEVVGRTSVELGLIKPEDRRRYVQEIEKHGRITDLEMDFRGKDGRVLRGLVNGEQVTVGGRPCLLTAAVNITERRQAEVEISTILRTTIDGYYLVDLEGRILEVNDVYCAMIGYSREELRQIGISGIEAIETQEFIRQRIQRILETGSDRFETKHIRKDGKIIDIEASVNLLTEPGRLVIFMRDITERKRAEEAMRGNEARLQSLFDNSPIGIWDEDFSAVQVFFDELRAAGVSDFRTHFDAHPGDVARCATLIRVREVNQTSVKLLGAASKTELTSNLTAHFSSEAWQVFKEELIELAGGSTEFSSETPTRMPSGEEKIMAMSLVVVPGHEKKLAKVLVSFQDITARKQAERRFRTLADAAFEGIVISEQGSIVEANDQALAMLGADRAEVIGHKVSEFVAPNSRDKVTAAVAAEQESIYEHDLRRKDGTLFTAEARARMLRLGDRRLRLTALRDVTERKLTEEKLRSNQEELAAVYDNAPVSLCLLDENLRAVRSNRAAAELWQTGQAENQGWHCGRLIGCVHAQNDQDCGRGLACRECVVGQAMHDTLVTGQSHRGVEGQLMSGRGPQPQVRHVVLHTARLEIAGRKHVLLCLEDITERNAVKTALQRAEEQFRQAQKMEAIGHLASGVAHDFNNILASVMLYLGLLHDEASPGQNFRSMLKELEKDVQRGANLTRQLLAFSRQQAMEPKVLDLHVVILDLVKMLHRLLGEHIALTLHSPTDLPRIEADSGMMEQVVVNLCVNARDAMPNGGQLDLYLDVVKLGADVAATNAEARAGRFLRLCVTDTGTGMDEQVLRHIFEPFYTTKESGKGTGLGLATVYGIVKQHQGWVEVESKVGFGTTFRVFLPASQASMVSSSVTTELRHDRGCGETILVVEDEPAVRAAVNSTLLHNGYQTRLAASGPEALRVWEKQSGKIDLLLTDMTMPDGMTGLELANRLRAKAPGLKIIVFTGYQLEKFAPQLASFGPVTLLRKPLDAAHLLHALRQCLDGG